MKDTKGKFLSKHANRVSAQLALLVINLIIFYVQYYAAASINYLLFNAVMIGGNLFLVAHTLLVEPKTIKTLNRYELQVKMVEDKNELLTQAVSILQDEAALLRKILDSEKRENERSEHK
ncbi:hypothetical protein J7384_17260 [Endozoicomonas sp. G2_1]|uniref:hypothetical protein n=1 Tax=Endozoicomonas sp. G2_1 TaxID=2821091 RepID=UPI001ADAB9B6|nr:hypothetical protein [Endozoicomonas sp. G2_1]MBO9492114.1 hypothetical protein [Endozoicomonas sp. G2_1]